MNWRNDKATYKQLNYIKELEDYYGVKFTGTTKGEASDYIAKVHKDNGLDNCNWENEMRFG